MSETVKPTTDRSPSRAHAGRRRFRAGAIVAVAAAAGLVVWLVVGKSGGSSPQRATAVPVSLGGLRTLAGAVPQPIYWVGRRPGVQYELTRTPDGRVYIRYLPRNAKIGEDTPHLTIGTYPVANAYRATSAVANRKNSRRIAVGNGAVAFYSTKLPTNVYLAYPGSAYQIEVFDPSAAVAQRVVASGQVKPVAPGGKSSQRAGSAGAVSTSVGGLKTLSRTLKQPIYWAGREPNVTYERTQTPDGRIYVRYLPPGVRVGTHKPYLTVGTYPVRNAFAVTGAVAQRKDSVRIQVGGGGVAFYGKAGPTSVYVAYPGSDYQIEVFGPSAQRARQLVSSGRVRPVR